MKEGGIQLLFRRKIPRSCTTCLFGTCLNAQQILCIKHGVVADSFYCRKYQYDPCKRIPPRIKAPDFSKYNEDDFTL